MRRFRALRTFESPPVKSTYVKDLEYTIRDGNYTLAILVEDWIERGLVEYCDPGETPKNLISASGIVLSANPEEK